MERFSRGTLLTLLLALGAAGCASDLQAQPSDAGGTGDGKIANVDQGGGVTLTTVDATATGAWVYLSLSTKAEVKPADPLHSAEWDLAFERFKIATNGGSSGSAGGGAAVVTGTSFDHLAAAPALGYLTDQADSDDEGTDPDLAFLVGNGWYAYDVSTHLLTPRAQVYVVRGGTGRYFKVQIASYYDAAGTAAHLSLRWAEVTAAAALSLDASDASSVTYLSFTTGLVPASSATSTSWDVGFSRTRLLTNGGTSGSGLAGAALAPAGAAWESIVDASTIGFTTDVVIPASGAPGSTAATGNAVLGTWYDYDSATHVVSPKDQIFLVRTATGGYAKLKLLTWSDGRYTLQGALLSRKVEIRTSTLAATDAASWTYLSLRSGQQVTVADPATSTAWDLAVSRTLWRTNGGTSGPGLGGALASGKAALADVTQVPADPFTADVIVPASGAPGSTASSGNSVLGAWYDYDSATHVASPKDVSFLVRAADGSFAKLKITSYAGGTYGLSWAYAGAGQTTF